MFRSYLVLFVALLGCQKSEPVTQKEQVRINIGDDPQTLDPRMARDLNSITVVHMLYEGLTRTGKTGELELALAEKVSVSEDGLEYRFSLRSSKWSNGDAVTSSDFAKSFLTILDPQFPTDIAYQLYGIKNAKQAKMGAVALSDVGVSTPDAQTLVIQLEAPMPYFLQLVAMPPFFPVREGAYNGPFQLKSWKMGERIEVVKNPLYWQADEVKLAELDLLMMDEPTEIQMFQQGKLDWAGSPLSIVPADAIATLKQGGDLQMNPFLATYFLRVNTKDPVLSNPLIRKALSYAIDRQSITTHILQGGHTPAFALVPPAMGLEEHGYFQEDGVLARQLCPTLAEPIRISFASSPRSSAIAQAIQQQWETLLGIKVELESVEPKIYYKKVANKEYQLAVGDWTADFNDPINFLEICKYDLGLTEYAQLLDRSAFCQNEQERLALLQRAEALLMDYMPIIPIFHYSLNYMKHQGLEEVALSPLGKLDFRWAHF